MMLMSEVGGFISLVDQYWVAWLTAILFGALLIAEILFFPETLYPRKLMLSRMPTTANKYSTGDAEKPSGMDVDMKRTRTLPFLNFQKVPGVEHPKPWDALVQFVKVWSFPNIAVAVFFYCFAWFVLFPVRVDWRTDGGRYWWVLSVITYLPVAYPQYTPNIQGLLFIGLILGTLICEIFCSGTLSDSIVLKLAKRNDGVRVPEMRLWLVYPAVLITASMLPRHI